MARPWRVEYEGAYYHVLSRGNERRDIFIDDRDRELFLAALGRTSERFNVDIFAFVLMNNHYHLLLRTNLPNLSRAMQWLGLIYARRFNNRLRRSGHLFQGRFKAIVVEDDAYMVNLSCYIHRNPLRAGMVKSLIEYRWSSYPMYACGKDVPQWLNTGLILSYFEGRDRRKAYIEKVLGYANEEGQLWEDLRHGLILGSLDFVKKIRFLKAVAIPHKEIPQQKKIQGSIDPMEVVKQVSVLLGRRIESHSQGLRAQGQAKEDRDIAIFTLWEMGLFRNEQIGELFGISYSAVSHIVRDVRQLVKRDPQVRNKVSKVNSQFKM